VSGIPDALEGGKEKGEKEERQTTIMMAARAVGGTAVGLLLRGPGGKGKGGRGRTGEPSTSSAVWGRRRLEGPRIPFRHRGGREKGGKKGGEKEKLILSSMSGSSPIGKKREKGGRKRKACALAARHSAYRRGAYRHK